MKNVYVEFVCSGDRFENYSMMSKNINLDQEVTILQNQTIFTHILLTSIKYF